MYGKSGLFPGEYVRPVAAPDFLVLPAERVEPRDRQGRVAASAAIAVAMGSAVAAHELDLSTEVHNRKLFTPITAAFFLTTDQQRNMMLPQYIRKKNIKLRLKITFRFQHVYIPLYYGISCCLYSIC